jgi:putative endonuclease
MQMASSASGNILRNTLRHSWIGVQTRAMRRLASLAHRRSPLPQHLITGERGEMEAIFYLRRQGYTIVARRWRNAKRRGDLDLIAWDGATLCFIEIKTRSRRDAVPAEAAVDHDKQETLLQLARSYIRRLPAPAQQAAMRFDVLSIYLQPFEDLSAESVAGNQPVTGRRSYLSKNGGPSFVLYKGAFSWA